MAAPIFALGIAGAGATGTIAGVIAGTVGALLDQYFVLPLLFGEEESAPAVGSVSATFAEEGAPVNYCRGAHNRLAGNLIYLSTPYAESTGGRSGKRAEPASVTWYADVIVETCHNSIVEFDRIFMDGDLVFQESPNLTTAGYSYQLSIRKIRVHLEGSRTVQAWAYYPGYTWIGGELGAWFLETWHMTVENQRAQLVGNESELAQFAAGEDIVVNWTGDDATVGFPSRTLEVFDSRTEGFSGGFELNVLKIDLAPFFKPQQPMRTTGGQFAWPSGGPYGPFVGQGGASGVPGNPPTVAYTGYPFQSTSGRWEPALGDDAVFRFAQTGQQWKPDLIDESLSSAFEGYPPAGGFPPTGGLEQTLPLYQSRVGVANAPGLPAIAGFEFARLNLSAFGQRVPQITFLVRAAPAGTGESDVKDAIEWVMEDIAGVHNGTAGKIVVDPVLDSADSYGLQFAGTGRPGQLLVQLLMANDAVVEESQGLYYVKTNTARDVVVVDLDDLDAREFGEPPGEPISIKLAASRVDRPRRLNLRYLDLTNDLQWGNEFAINDGIVDALTTDRSTRQMRLQIPLNPWEAKAIARRLLRDQLTSGDQVAFSLPPKYVKITETDVIQIDDYPETGETLYVLVNQIEHGVDFRVQIAGTRLLELPQAAPSADMALAGATEFIGTDNRERTRPQTVPLTTLMILDLAPLADHDASQSGIYLAYASAWEQAAGVQIYSEVGEGGYFVQEARGAGPSVIGYSTTALGTGRAGVVDYSTSVTVRVFGNDTGSALLSSTTEATMTIGVNRCVIGDEVLQFVTATPGDANVYTLTGLRRGLLGTEDQMGLHYAGERFVLIEPGSAQFHRMDLSSVGTSRNMVAAGQGRTPANDPATFVPAIQLASSLPLPVWNLRAYRLGSGDVVIDWNRRSRISHRPFSAPSLPLAELTENYDVVVDPDGVDRTIAVTAETATYTAAMQATDSLTDLELAVEVYQRDSVRGRGRVATLTVQETAGVFTLEDGSGSWLLENGNRMAKESP